MCWALSYEAWPLPLIHQRSKQNLISEDRNSWREMTVCFCLASFLSQPYELTVQHRDPCRAPISPTASCSLHHSCCSNYGHTMWQADGMALHQAFLACTPSKIKKNVIKQEGMHQRQHLAKQTVALRHFSHSSCSIWQSHSSIPLHSAAKRPPTAVTMWSC